MLNQKREKNSKVGWVQYHLLYSWINKYKNNINITYIFLKRIIYNFFFFSNNKVHSYIWIFSYIVFRNNKLRFINNIEWKMKQKFSIKLLSSVKISFSFPFSMQIMMHKKGYAHLKRYLYGNAPFDNTKILFWNCKFGIGRWCSGDLKIQLIWPRPFDDEFQSDRSFPKR